MIKGRLVPNDDHPDVIFVGLSADDIARLTSGRFLEIHTADLPPDVIFVGLSNGMELPGGPTPLIYSGPTDDHMFSVIRPYLDRSPNVEVRDYRRPN